MKTLSLLLVALLGGALISGIAAEHHEGQPGKLNHVVSFKFKETATPDQIKQVEDAFRDLKKKIPQIASYHWGTNNSPENLNKGFTHMFILTFKSEADRAVYLPHPDHKKFGQMLGPVLGDVFVFDFMAKD